MKTPRLLFFFIAALGFAVGWHVFLRMNLERVGSSRLEKTIATDSELRHKIILQDFEHRLQYQEQLATFIDAFIRSSVMVRPDEFRQFLIKSGVWNQRSAPRLVVILGDHVDASLYSCAAKGFTFHSALTALLHQPDGSILIDDKDENLLLRSFHLSPDASTRIEGKGTGRTLNLVFLFDGKSLMEELAEQLPSATGLTIRNNTLDPSGQNQWTFEPQKPAPEPGLRYSYALQVGHLSWDISWQEAAPKAEVRRSSFVKEVVGFGLAIVSGLALLGLALYPAESKQPRPQPLDLLFKINAPVWHLDGNGFIVDMNEAALVYAKRKREDLIGVARIQDIVKSGMASLANESLGLGEGETLALGPWAVDSQPRVPAAAERESKPQQPLPVVASPDDEDGFDLEHFKSLTGLDIHVLEEVRKISLKSLPVQYENLRELVKQGESRKIMLAAHTLKSSLSLLGSKTARDICFQIEQNPVNGQALQSRVDRMGPLLQKIARELKEAKFEQPEPQAEENPFKRKRVT